MTEHLPEGYGYIALQPINIDGVRAFNTGDPVPDSHVKDHGFSDDMVAKAGTKKAKQAMGLEEEPATGTASATAGKS